VIGRLAFAGVIVAALAVATPVHAQRVGITAGATMSEINSSGAESLNVLLTDKLEPAGGVLFTVDASTHIAIQYEALYSVKGTRFSANGRRTDVNLNYLEMPRLVRVAPSIDGPTRWLRLFGGPYLGRLLGARVHAGSEPSRDLEINAWDLGWIAGIGAEFTHFRVDFRYGGSFSDLNPDFTDIVPEPTNGVKFRNRTFTLLAAYVF
jgi:hypothetical protein